MTPNTATARASRDHVSAPAPSGIAPVSFSFTAPRSRLFETLGAVVSATAGGKFLPILQSVLVESGPNGITFSATELDRWVTSELPSATPAGTGRAALPAKRLLEIVSALPVGVTVTVQVIDRKAKITAGRSRFELIGMDPSEWPTQPEMDPTLTAELDAPAFIGGVQRVQAHAAGKGDPVLLGACLEASPDGLALVATCRTTLARVQLADVSPFTAQCNIPSSTFASIGKLFQGEATIRIEANESYCCLTGERSTLSFRLIDGQFPPYRSLLCLAHALSVEVDRAELIDAVKRAAVIANDTTNMVTFRFRQNEIGMSAQTSGIGNSDDAVAAVRTIHDAAGQGRGINLAAWAVANALASIHAERVVLQYHGKERPLYVRDAIAPDSPTVAVIAPLRWLAAEDDPAEAEEGSEDV